MQFETIVGILASTLTAVSLLPQLIKLIKEKRSKDLSVAMLSVLLAGQALWIYYGIIKEDPIISISNGVAFLINLITIVLAMYWRQR